MSSTTAAVSSHAWSPGPYGHATLPAQLTTPTCLLQPLAASTTRGARGVDVRRRTHCRLYRPPCEAPGVHGAASAHMIFGSSADPRPGDFSPSSARAPVELWDMESRADRPLRRRGTGTRS